MRRICAYCKTYMGEKCGDCGSEQTTVIYRDGPFSIWKCQECNRKWRTGEDPDTTGICETCISKVKVVPHAA